MKRVESITNSTFPDISLISDAFPVMVLCRWNMNGKLLGLTN
jgi:hypothetical protein